MSEDGHDALREVARELLRELLPELLHDAASGGRANGSARNGAPPRPTAATPSPVQPVPAPSPVPLVPAPPVAAVLRPSTWSAPPAPGEVIGEGLDAPPASGQSEQAEAAEPSAARSPSAAAGGSRPRRPGRVEAVRVADQHDLDRFVAMLALRLESPRERRALRTGELRFVLSGAAAGARAHGPASAPGGMPEPAHASAHRIERGAVTERLVREAAAGGMRLVLGPAAVLTPLARDRARAMGVQIEREG
ncbi:MAG TPA: hypothetical protein VKV27_15640 [Solirubrobacteraceae bacterium]|nr:hypothetical protein [Solirubrobacteraceae bacterium]